MPERDAPRIRAAIGHRVAVLAHRDFRRFYVGQVTSLLGTWMSSVAVTFAVLGSGVSADGLGVVMAAGILPQVAFVLGGGVLADRIGRRPVMLGADALCCAAQAALAVALLAGRPPIWLFAVLAALVGTGQAFFGPALNGLMTEIAPRAELGDANALYGLAQSATRIIGPSLAGLVVALAGPAVVIAVDAASYGVSVAALALLRPPQRPAAPPPAPGARAHGARAAPVVAAPGGGGLGRVPVPGLALGDHAAVRAVQPHHLGPVPAARPGAGQGIPRRGQGLGAGHGGRRRRGGAGRPVRARPPAASPAGRRDPGHVRVPRAVLSPCAARCGGRGSRRCVRRRHRQRAVQHVLDHHPAAAGPRRPGVPGQLVLDLRGVRGGHVRARDRRARRRAGRARPGARRRGGLGGAQQPGRAQPALHPRDHLVRRWRRGGIDVPKGRFLPARWYIDKPGASRVRGGTGRPGPPAARRARSRTQGAGSGRRWAPSRPSG